MIGTLAEHQGIGMLMGRSTAARRARHGRPRHALPGQRSASTATIQRKPFGEHAITGLKRVDGMPNAPDLVAISLLDAGTGEVAAFEELIGSHGGLGGPQTEPFILHPADWQIDEPIVGAEDVYRQIRRWLSNMGIELGPADRRGRSAG